MIPMLVLSSAGSNNQYRGASWPIASYHIAQKPIIRRQADRGQSGQGQPFRAGSARSIV
jgi:hypothetical protein